MLKLFKWDLLDFIHRYSVVVIGMIACFLFAILAIKSVGDWNSTLMILSTLLGFITFPAMIIIAAILPIQWLTRESELLERSLPFPAWKTLTSKLVFALVLNFICCYLFFQLSAFWGSSTLEKINFLSLQNLQGLPVLILLLLLADTTMMFTYILAKSFNVFRGLSVFAAGLISFFLIGGFAVLTIMTMNAAGLMILPDVSASNNFTVNGTFQFLSVAMPSTICLFLIVIEFIGSSSLLEKRFQKN